MLKKCKDISEVKTLELPVFDTDYKVSLKQKTAERRKELDCTAYDKEFNKIISLIDNAADNGCYEVEAQICYKSTVTRLRGLRLRCDLYGDHQTYIISWEE